jgi:purine-cytosine permease-like protein
MMQIQPDNTYILNRQRNVFCISILYYDSLNGVIRILRLCIFPLATVLFSQFYMYQSDFLNQWYLSRATSDTFFHNAFHLGNAVEKTVYRKLHSLIRNT